MAASACHNRPRVATDVDVRVVDNPSAHRFEVWSGTELAGFAAYRLEKDRVVFTHTEIDGAFEGKGFGGRLAAGALDQVRDRGLAVVPRCPFIRGFIERHEQYADLVVQP